MARMTISTRATSSIEVRAATADEVIELRHAVLRPGFPREAAIFPLDRDPATHHFVAIADGGRIVGCVTISRPRPIGDDVDAIQLRAMAVAEDFRSAGIGRKLLARVDEHVRLLPPPRPLLWCNARVGAIRFYERCGWTVVSDVFDSPPAGPHVKMSGGCDRGTSDSKCTGRNMGVPPVPSMRTSPARAGCPWYDRRNSSRRRHSSDNPCMPFDALVANPGRLRILTALAAARKQRFVELRRRTGLTDGNLCTHARRLQSAGFIAIEKSIEAGKPLTTLQLTSRGRDALAAHANALLRSLEPPPAPPAPIEQDDDQVDDWVD